MEQKRTLWILIASGVFLCTVIIVAVISYCPGARKDVTAVSQHEAGNIWVSSDLGGAGESVPQPQGEVAFSSSSASSVPQEGETSLKDANPSAAVVEAANAPSVSSNSPIYAQSDNVTVISNGTTNVYHIPDENASKEVSSAGTVIDLNTLKSSSPAVSSNVTAQNKAAEKAMKQTEEERQKQSNIAKTLDESTKRTTTATKPATSTSTASTKATTQPSAKPATTASVAKTSSIPDRYWVQAASYSSKKKADEARSLLDEKQIQCEVFTYEKDGALYYRVRVGPYSTKDEAAYWKKQVESIELFAKANTYIVNSSAPLAKN